MKKITRHIAAGLMVLAVSVSLVSMPAAHTAVAYDFGSGFTTNFDSTFNFDTTTDNSVSTSNFTFTECVLTVDDNEIFTGEDVTLTWETTGFTEVKLNGETLSDYNGNVTIKNLQENTTYTLEALNDQGATCLSSVTVTCLPPPPPKFCELDITKAVDKTTAQLSDTLEYIITLTNNGDADCTDVVMTDALDDYFVYDSYTYTSNFAAANGSYDNGSNTFTFTANKIEPNQTGTIVVMGDIMEPTQCGEFTIPNQAKVTATELTGYTSSQIVNTVVSNDCSNPAPECTLTPTLQYIDSGESATLTWTTTNATDVTLTTFGSVELNGNRSVSPTTNTTYTLTATGPGGEKVCPAEVKINTDVPAPSCDLFVAEPDALMIGATSTLRWETSDATLVTINNGIGNVEADGSTEIEPTVTTTYEMTVYGTDNQQVRCEETVTVSQYPVPSCDLFDIDPNPIVAGATSSIKWETTNATRVVINNGVGEVIADGSVEISPLVNTEYIMTVFGENGQQDTCSDSITVNQTEVFSCANNVNFSASDTSIRRGTDITLNWNVTGADSVALNGSAVLATDNTTVSPDSDTTYTLTATKSGFSPISCPVSIDVSSGGGGGGGSASPRCELDISDKKITRGEEIEIEWETSSAREVTLIDDRGNVLFTTDDYLARDKEDYYDGAITLKPTRDTKYTLIAERGTRDRECEVEVEVEDDIVVVETRTQQPLVTGIALSQVPYTGFEAGPILTALFYMLLIAWSLFITYLIVIRSRMTPAFAGSVSEQSAIAPEKVAAMQQAEAIRPDVFTNVAPAAPATAAPANLPTGTAPVGYEVMATAEHQATDVIVTDLENRAHAQKALLSSDAVRYFISTTEGSLERNEALDTVIAEAKGNYPLEDGWIVVNEARMRHLCETCLADTTASTEAPFIPATVPEGTGSLAEAIVTGNVVAAYEMIGSRPMFALADAAADLDAVYRARKGERVVISDMLRATTADLSDEQITDMITALTGALDGTYTDEASAVKMAIMKAVKVVG